MNLSMEFQYLSIAVVEMHENNVVTVETISIMEGDCSLSGAWEFKADEKSALQDVIKGRPILILGNKEVFRKFVEKDSLIYLTLDSFLKEAREAAELCLIEIRNYKSENMSKRKNVVEPIFYDWPDYVDLNNAFEFMDKNEMMATPKNTPELMKRTLAASRLVKFFIDKWQEDEQERKNRKYLANNLSKTLIVPSSWLKQKIIE